jgi:nucleotide-binding universal stress UspA family protein
MEEGAKTYLDRIGGEVAKSVPVQTALLEGNAGDQLLSYLKERPAGLVVVASRGRSGIVRATLGSVADRMLHGPAPVLILRPDEEIRSRLVTEALAATA